ncbi:MAG: hypothetical protein CL928_03945, partial [Deltaproteobacteria bacterium]|nr:hypothetical protein [Deltaproteobacteria bacterium]
MRTFALRAVALLALLLTLLVCGVVVAQPDSDGDSSEDKSAAKQTVSAEVESSTPDDGANAEASPSEGEAAQEGGAIRSERWFGSADTEDGVPWGYFTLLLLILTTGGLMLYFTKQAQQGKEMFIRRMPGIDAIEDGIGRATEMGKPVLYVPGIDELQDI